MNHSKRSKPATGSGNGLENTLQSTSKDTTIYTDFTAKKHLKELHVEAQKRKYDLPYYSAPDFKVSTTSGLTKAVVHFLKLNGHQAERINSTGRIIDNSQVVGDVMGYRRTIGSKQWIPGAGTKGTAYISATINGKSVKLEIKNIATLDRQSEAQRQYQKSIENSGGIYLIVTSFSMFLNWYYGQIFGGRPNE